MVMNTNSNNYKLDSPSANKDFYPAASHPINYNNWYSDSSTQHETVDKEQTEDTGRCRCFAGLCRQGQRSAQEEAAPNNVMASYGVYGNGREEDDDDGFARRPRYQHTVVNVTGNTSIVRENNYSRTCCMTPSCCTSGSAVPGNNCCATWCRPTILLLLLVLLVVVFVLISGILLYYNCKYSMSSCYVFIIITF